MFNEKIKPSLVLTLICLITCALLVFAYNKTYIDNTGVITAKMSECLSGVYGTADGFTMMKNDDGTVFAPEGVTSVIADGNGNTAFEIITSGYSNNGLDVLVGLDANGAVKGVALISISETPGLGTKVQNPDFLNQFSGLTVDKLPTEAVDTSAGKKKVWGSESEITSLKDAAAAQPASDSFELDAVTGATFSSKGMNRAVTTALNAYSEMKGAEQK